jgi:4-phytase / acid phosphatase
MKLTKGYGEQNVSLNQSQRATRKRANRIIQSSNRLLVAVALLLVIAIVEGQSPSTKVKANDHLRFTLILSRHGIRPPLAVNSTLNLNSSDPWPAWEVPPGYLTPHGALAIQKMGAYLRLDFARNGLLPAFGCPEKNEIYLATDTDERNIESTRATFAGLEPGCDPLAINTGASKGGAKDPLYSAIPSLFPPPSQDAVLADQRATFGSDPQAFFSAAANPGLDVFARILEPDPGHPAAKPILDDPRPLAAASSLVEDLLLEYVDDKPMSEVGWGRVDEATLRHLIPLHTKQFSASARSLLAARTQGSNLMAHMLWTLEQAAQSGEHKSVPGAIGPDGARLVYLSGHDTNLNNIGGLLNVHWTADGRTDDTPPDSQIVFELWQNSQTKQYTVRLRFRAQTLDQLRSGEDLSLRNSPVEVDLTPPGCQANHPCPFSSFDRAVHGLLDPVYVKIELPPMREVQSLPTIGLKNQ